MSVTNEITWESLTKLMEGQEVTVHIVDFDNTNFPKDANPREITGEVVNIKGDVGHSAGEIERTVTIGNPWEGGCHIDVGDTAENKLTGGTNSPYKYTKAWRPRAGKDRLLLGKVHKVELINE